MALSKKLQVILDRAKQSDSYWIEKIKLGFALSLEARRRNKGMTNSDLAKEVGVSQAYMSKVFRGDTNFTIETMVKLARATGGSLQLEIVDDVSHSAPVFVLNNYRKASVTQQAQSVVVSDAQYCANGTDWGRFSDVRAAA